MGKSTGYNSHYYATQSVQPMHSLVHGGSFSSGLGNFATAIGNRQVDTAKTYYSGPSLDTLKGFIPNFTDSMSQLDKDSSDFNQELYDVLSDAEKQQLADDKGFTGWDLAYVVPFIGLFQNTREAWDEMTGSRHPEILTSAITKYNAKVKKDEAQVQADALKKQMDYQQKKMMDSMREEFNNKLQNSGGISHLDHTVSNSPITNTNIPIDITRGRGLANHPKKTYI